jgi:hypothetical protein
MGLLEQIEARETPLCPDSAEFGCTSATSHLLAVSMYQLDEATGKRNGQVCKFTT